MTDILNNENHLYKTAIQPWRYGNDEVSYVIAAAFLDGGVDGDMVEDWGCGTAYAKRFFTGPYRGIDGSWSPWADEQVALIDYHSNYSRLMMRHVLEHNWEWRTVLKNFMASWRDRACIILFLHPEAEDHNVSFSDPNGIPGLALCEKDLTEILHQPDVVVSWVDIMTQTPPQNFERIIFLRRS